MTVALDFDNVVHKFGMTNLPLGLAYRICLSKE
ncbi:hypothetical protein PRUB_a6002 [Pseudoalteromonas rubra]|uniref:Uncharacterized protein n=1 Tax=Pseudoalteromonas rubra TaxID=43658 RepID=A0A8T0CAZ1_9GAMM|nr:hypothetical protein PRUB_a6002 [Pseudoalteromonas rubra]